MQREVTDEQGIYGRGEDGKSINYASILSKNVFLSLLLSGFHCLGYFRPAEVLRYSTYLTREAWTGVRG